jgi:hypothetical protein
MFDRIRDEITTEGEVTLHPPIPSARPQAASLPPERETPNGDPTSDEGMAAEARARLAKRGDLQLVAEIYENLRSQSFEWWTPSFTMQTWPATARMEWLAERPDLRQSITSQLTGLPRRTAREKDVAFQAGLIESVIACGDVAPETVERAFSATDIALYGPAREIWSQFRQRFPWHQDTPENQRFVSWLIRALLVDRSSFDHEMSRKPILTPCDVRTAIGPAVWHTRIPLEVRIAVDVARLKLERGRPREPFHTGSELAIATPEILATHIPLIDLVPVFAAADAALNPSEPAKNAAAAGGDELRTPPPVSSVRGMPAPLITLRRVG